MRFYVALSLLIYSVCDVIIIIYFVRQITDISYKEEIRQLKPFYIGGTPNVFVDIFNNLSYQ